jgi:predicted component of type VI protein secretion system
MPKLYVLSGPDTGKSFELEAGALVGRDPDCAVRLRDPSVSRKHARLEHGERGWSIVDTQSRNGIHVDGKRVATVELADGAEVSLGEVLVRFREQAAQVARPVPASRAPEAAPAARAEAAQDAEIVLEGDWEVAATRVSPRSVVPAPVDRSPARPPNRPSDPERTAPEIAPAPRAETVTSGVIRAPGATAAPNTPGALGAPGAIGAPGPAAPGGVVHRAQSPTSSKRGVLQYQRVADRPGFFHADLAQQPWWLKLALALVAIAVFLVLFWLAFRGTSFLKSKTQLDAPDAEAQGER